MNNKHLRLRSDDVSYCPVRTVVQLQKVDKIVNDILLTAVVIRFVVLYYNCYALITADL